MNEPSWNQGRVLAFDLETTGVDPETARIVTASIVVMDSDRPRFSETWLIDPGVEIPQEATDVHGITTEHAQTRGMKPEIAVPEIAKALEVETRWETGRIPLVVYNAPYDLTVLDRELRRVDPELTWGCPNPVIDPYVIDRQLDKYRPGKRTLSNLCEHYGIELSQAHTSEADAVAAGQLAYKLAEAFRQITQVPPAYLHERQVAWYAEQSASFGKYLETLADRNNHQETADALRARASSLNSVWPLIP